MTTIWATNGFPEMTVEEMRDHHKARALIRRWVDEGRAEDLYLDFKTKADRKKGQPDADDLSNYTKAISGFANSDGGLLVWGVEAKPIKSNPEFPDVAQHLCPLRNAKAYHAALNALVHNATTPAVSGVLNLFIPQQSDGNAGFVVTYVPAGLNPPYRADLQKDYKYYKRAGSSFYQMAPYDLRDVVFRFRYPKIDLEFGRDVEREQTDVVQYCYALRLEIGNHGPAILKDYIIEITLPRVCSHNVHDWRREVVEYGGCQFETFRLYASVDPEHFAVYPGDTKRILGTGQPFGLRYVVVPDDRRIPREGLGVRLRLLADRPPETRGMPFADEQAITASEDLWSEVRAVCTASLPDAPGIYEVFLVRPESFVGTPLAGVSGGSLLYIGAARSLAGPDFRQHFTDNAGGFSGFRHSIGAVLHDSLGLKARRSSACSAYCFDEEGENRLTEWMVRNLGVSWRVCPSEADAASKVRGIVKRLQPVVNTIPGINGRYDDLIENLRSRCREEADRE